MDSKTRTPLQKHLHEFGVVAAGRDGKFPVALI